MRDERRAGRTESGRERREALSRLVLALASGRLRTCRDAFAVRRITRIPLAARIRRTFDRTTDALTVDALITDGTLVLIIALLAIVTRRTDTVPTQRITPRIRRAWTGRALQRHTDTLPAHAMISTGAYQSVIAQRTIGQHRTIRACAGQRIAVSGLMTLIGTT